MNILITGAGGAAAISVWKSLESQHNIHMADMDTCAAGLYLVPPNNRHIIPAGHHPEFNEFLYNICEQHNIELLIPTVDAELLPLSHAQHRFISHGIKLSLSSTESLMLCRDKSKLLEFCQDTGLTPKFVVLNDTTPDTVFQYPCFAKPCLGAGSKGAMIIHSRSEFNALPRDNSYLVQEWLPGEEYSVDIYIQSNKIPLAAVPRLRMKIDSGIAVAAQTIFNPKLSAMALNIAQKVDITYVANIQFKANEDGVFKLLEINPRFPGTLPLTTAAGIDIPKLLIKDMLGEPLGNKLLPFKELMVVRYWTEKFVKIDEWHTLCRI